jgi:F-type H+-transporting ATPase subunit b
MPEFNATLIFIMVSFLIFMILMKIIYFDPMLKIKYERERKLTDDRESAQRFAQDYDRIRAEYEAGLKQARREALQLIQEVRQQAKANAQQTITQARLSAQGEMDQRMGELAEWRESTYRQLEDERTALTRAIIRKVTDGRRVGSVSGG